MAVANPTEYYKKRREYWARYPEFPYANCPPPGGSGEEYAIYGALGISRQDVAEMRTASERLFPILRRIAQRAQHADDQALLAMGIPQEALAYVRVMIPDMPVSVAARFEYAMTAEGLKLIEINAETPTVILEGFLVNSLVCKDFGLADPNLGCADQLPASLQTAVHAGLAWLGFPEDATAHVGFTSYGHFPEDRSTTNYLLNLLPPSPRYRTSYSPITDLRVSNDGLFDAKGERIDVLYKLYPTEYLVRDQDEDGSPFGLAVMDLVVRGKLAIINPPVSFLLQNKALIAMVWALHLHRDPVFSTDEHDWIERYVIPTYMDLTHDDGTPVFSGRYIAKPIYGREGGSSTVYDGQKIVETNANMLYADQIKVYQELVALPRVRLNTEDGEQEMNLVHSCFVVNGKASAVGARPGPTLIIDDASYFIALQFSD